MQRYRGYDIEIDEKPEYDLEGGKLNASARRMVYQCTSAVGSCWALTPGQAIQDMYEAIDRELDG